MVVPMAGQSSLAVLFGAGDGNFQPPLNLPLSAPATFAGIADFTGDGRPDIVVSSVTIVVIPGNADGTFGTPVDTGISGRILGLGDFNGDGKQDLLMLTAQSGVASVSALLSRGNGGFLTTPSYAIGESGFDPDVAWGDFNRDGLQDIAVLARVSSPPPGTFERLTVLLGQSNGTFRSVANAVDSTVVRLYCSGDFTGDGRPDLIVGGNIPAMLMAGNGDGTFQTGAAAGIFIEQYAIVSAADLNGDAISDLIFSGSTTGVFLGAGNGTFLPLVQLFVGPQTSPVSIPPILSDLDGDRKLDLILGNGAYDTVSVTLGNGDGSFETISVLEGPSPLSTPIAGDFNNDGIPDLLAGSSDSLVTFLGNGDGTFQNGIAGDYTSPARLAAADFNGDGKLDVAILGQIALPLRIQLGNGDGTFRTAAALNLGNSLRDLAVGDFNHDGNPDIAVMGLYAPGTLWILPGNGDGSLGAPVATSLARAPSIFTVADFNGDGFSDLAVKYADEFGAATVAVLLSRGDGTFETPLLYPRGDQPQALVTADLNADGKTDLIIPDGFESVAVLLGNGDGTFRPESSYRTGVVPMSAAVTDINRDGKPDLVVANRGQSDLSMFLGNGDGTFQPPFFIGPAGEAMAIADFNSDGRPDFAFAGGSIGISVLASKGSPGSAVPTTIRSNPTGLSFVENGVTYVSPHTFSWTAGSSHSVSWLNPQPVGSGLRYTFARWDDGISSIARTFTVPENLNAYTADFTAQYLLTVAVSPPGAGTLSASPASADGYYDPNTVVELTPVASAGYTFAGFGGAVECQFCFPGTVTMTAPETVTASFAACAPAAISPQSQNFPYSGGTGSVFVPADNCGTDPSSVSWVTITQFYYNNQSVTITYAVAANPSLAPRTGTLIFAGAIFTVTQDGNNQAFVSQLYLDLLERNADPGGLAFWTNDIDSSALTRAQVAQSFFTSPEFGGNGAFVFGCYLGILGRNADFSGWDYWYAALQGDNLTQTAVLNSFLASPEYAQRFGAPDTRTFVDELYQNTLKRAPDPAGESYWINALNTGAFTRAQVVTAFIVSPEFVAGNRNLVNASMLYFGFLRRNSDPSGLSFWLGELDGGFPLKDAINGFITSPEYLARF